MSENVGGLPSPKRRLWIVGGVILSIFAATVLTAFISFRRDVSPGECFELEQLKNVSIAHLENGRHKEKRGAGQGDLAKADAGFVELAEKLPADPLGPRNLAITRLLELQEKLIAPEIALEAADLLLRLENDSAPAHLLAGQLAQAAHDKPRAAAEFGKAAELAPTDAAIWFLTSRFWLESPDDADQKRGREALGRAYQAAPDNLFLQQAWLSAQAQAHDPEIVQTLRQLRQLLAARPGLLDNLRKHARIADPLAFVDKALAPAEQGQWAAAAGPARQLANVILGETWSQSDLGRVNRDPLEYLLYDFHVPCDDKTLEVEAPIEVKFSELAAPMQLPPLLGLQDIGLADFDLDGGLDVVALREASIEIYGRAGNGDEWRMMASTTLPPGHRRLLLADLDQDDPEQPGTAAYAQRQAAGKPPPAPKEEPPEKAKPEHGGAGAGAGPRKPCHRTSLDAAVYGDDGVLLLRNVLNADKQTRELKIEPHDEFALLKPALALAAVDFDHDGDLDLVVSSAAGISLWSNHGDMTFADVSPQSQLPPAALRANSIVGVDWNGDVDLDLILTGPTSEAPGYLENLRHGQFRWRAFAGDFTALRGASSVALVDTGDVGGWVLAAGGKAGLTVIRTELGRQAEPNERSTASLTLSPRSEVRSWDFDNDGHSDLLSWSEAGIDIYRSDGQNGFAAVPQLLARGAKPIRSCQAGDIDGDGDLDLAVAEADRIALYDNDGGDQNHWLDLELVAGLRDDQNRQFRVNHYGIGSLIEVRTGPIYQRQIIRGPITHFGLGRRERPDMVRIVWTNGIPQDILEVEPDRTICEAQILGGSCPYLYTWMGDKFEFFTDCLWAAPLGLQVADGVLAPSRAWEYLHIPGRRLQPRDGEYVLQITEELWEAAYLDHVQLIAVDHPADVAIYSNEKVGPADLAEFKIHTVREPRRPRAARDQRGRDVLDRVWAADGVYLKAFDRKLGFGYAEPHYLELDLGELADPRRITLFLTGWIFPTGTSMNVGISQNARLDPPRPPSLWVPDAAGQWQEVRPDMGFPGGKTKTIAVDLSGVFLTDDYRVRIATNMELYWDEAFFTVDESPAPTQSTPLTLAAADLHYRGFSRRAAGSDFGPEHYDYEQTTTEPKWPAMSGRFTRYGDVAELLTETDDRLAILGAGDELTLRFTVPVEKPPAGWTRDFLLYNVGWDKDADLNTVYGQTVEPLPFGAASGQAAGADQLGPSDARYRAYLRNYQTRIQDPLEFRTRVSGGRRSSQ